MLQTFHLDAEFGPTLVDGQLIKTLQHESVAGAYTYEFNVANGIIIFSVSRGILREVSYRYSSILPWVRAKHCVDVLAGYNADGEWNLVYQDKTGKMYHSAGEQYYAAIGKGTKFVNVGSMIFHEEKFKIVS